MYMYTRRCIHYTYIHIIGCVMGLQEHCKYSRLKEERWPVQNRIIAWCLLLFFFIILIALLYSITEIRITPRAPPMGWNSWNLFECDGLNENVVKQTADILNDSGLASAGYVYVNLDDCWHIDRDEDGVLVPDSSKFPSGMKHLSDYIHSKGLKFGVYTDMGILTCQRRPGSFRHEEQDAKTFASWGVDFVKNDDCNLHPGGKVYKDYKKMHDSLKQTGRSIIHSIKGCLEIEKAATVSNMRRVGHDIIDDWDSMLDLVDIYYHQEQDKYVRTGFWPDLDMLEVGNGEMTTREYIAHFSLWCSMKAPLLLGNDIRKMDHSTKEILTHVEALAVHKDPLVKPVKIVWEMTDTNSETMVVTNKQCDRYNKDQQWVYDTQSRFLKQAITGKCMSVEQSYIFVRDCRNAENFYWDINDKRQIESNGKCLTSNPVSDHFPAKLRDCNEREHKFGGQNRWSNPWNDAFYFDEVSHNETEKTFLIRNYGDKCLKVGGNPVVQVFSGPLANGKQVVLVLNRDIKNQIFSLDFSVFVDSNQQTEFRVRDIWEKRDLGKFEHKINIELLAHSVKFLIFSST